MDKKRKLTIKDNLDFIVLLMLLISSIALIVVKYNRYIPKVDEIFSFQNQDPKNLSRIVSKPLNIVLNIDKNTTTILEESKEQIQEETYTALRTGILSENIEKVNPEEYKQATQNNSSLILRYPKIPAKTIEKSLDLVDTRLSKMQDIEEIAYIITNDYTDTIYIKTNEIFRIKKTLKISLPQVEIQTKKPYTKYYPILDYVTNNKTDVLIPLNFKRRIDTLDFKYSLNKKMLTELPQRIFGQRLDFTSYIRQEDGTDFYSYNNAKEVLFISKDGILDYKKEITKTVKEITKDEAIETALDFLEKTSPEPQIYEIMEIEEKIDPSQQKIYTIYLSKTLGDDLKISSLSDIMEYIQVSGGEVVNAKLEIYSQNIYGKNIVVNPLNPLQALDRQIKTILEKTKFQTSKQVIESIEDIRLIYYNNKRTDKLEPSWYYKTTKGSFVIDIEEGNIKAIWI